MHVMFLFLSLALDIITVAKIFTLTFAGEDRRHRRRFISPSCEMNRPAPKRPWQFPYQNGYTILYAIPFPFSSCFSLRSHHELTHKGTSISVSGRQHHRQSKKTLRHRRNALLFRSSMHIGISQAKVTECMHENESRSEKNSAKEEGGRGGGRENLSIYLLLHLTATL